MFEILMKIAEIQNFIESYSVYIWLVIVIVALVALACKVWNEPIFDESEWEDWGG